MKFLKLLTTLLISITTMLFSILPTQAQIPLGSTGEAMGINIGNIRMPNPDPGRITVQDADYTISLHNQNTESGRINLEFFNFSNNFSDTIITEDYTISLTREKNGRYLNYTATRNKKNYYCDSPHNPQIFTVPLPTISVFNTKETINTKIKVHYAECTNKDPITAYFTPTEVQYGATTWNLTLHTTEKATINQQELQYWTHKFNIHSIVNSGDNMIIISMTPRLQDRLEDIECTAYNLTIPKNALTSTETRVKNTADIIGDFRVTNCPPPPPTNGEDGDGASGENGTSGVNSHDGSNSDPKMSTGSTLKEGNLYLSLLDTDENGKQYVNITNLVYLLGVISFFLVVFWSFFTFIRNSFLGKK